MKLVFLHGAPAVGKLTVAKALLRLVPGRLFDNHAAIDVARTVFEFGAPGFWELIRSVRAAVLEAAAEHDVPLVIVTYCYVEPEDRPELEQFEAIMRRHGGELLPVYLHCAEAEVLRRIGNPDRAERRKITTAQGLAKFAGPLNITAVPRTDCLMLDTEARPADATAREIVRHFRLDGGSA